jgi:hypothetical protein
MKFMDIEIGIALSPLQRMLLEAKTKVKFEDEIAQNFPIVAIY